MKTDKDFQKVVESLSKNYLNKVLKIIDKLIKENNIQNIYSESHKLKGSGKTYGFDKISIVSLEVEELCKQLLTDKTEDIKKNKDMVIKKIKKLKNLTEEYICIGAKS
ncbi:MAG: hypothetical protein HAW60_01140 [Bdellovibrionales bacterium]|nr:hypothetical protein [Bdellovibrionales bacterium]